MDGLENANDYFIWGVDHSPYGPVELSVLIDWIRDERVLADTWIFARPDGTWRRAADVPELREHFSQETAASPPIASKVDIKPGSLRRIKILAQMNDAQLDRLAEFMEVQKVPQWFALVKQGDPGNGMFFVLQGELRARVMVGEKETILATFGPGDFFGDMSLFDHGPRSADVIANAESIVLKMSDMAFERLTREAPALATPFLQATARTLAARIRADNRRLDRLSQQFSASV
ncbi:MAG TPA: cyclic nucleotide-binding domain-containing protein [Candidatus Acidoferrum sp.]|nr:cyclic nucleotide-binding domain-containing protein [Candidatus Acidoferrum sp.]